MSGSIEPPTIPAIHALHLAELVKGWNVTHEELFSGLDLDDEFLSEPEARLSIPTLEKLVARARALTGKPALGFYLGFQMRISAHGFLGFAAMTSATTRDAIQLAAQFAPTRTSALAFRLCVDGDVASVVIDEQADFGTARDVVIPAILIGLWQIANALTGRELRGSADLAFPEPDYFAKYAHLFPAVRFGQPVNQLVFDATILDLPLTMADPAARRLAVEQCERALDALGGDGRLIGRVRSLIPRKDGGFRSLDEVASELRLSPRTLKRKLAAQAMAYSTLLEEQQRDKALLLLRALDLSLENVAERLGYSDPANFTRAFRRWTGLTPSAYRRTLTSPERK
ncbi:AraC family transcriptional regulator [Pendulispora albinea]|uniref:AraC family transcriptional regulator n=1 Tax=Pendulispora albinea TaxID=2741071 RepID=A0ABZ2MBT9_9BACT